MGWMYIFPCNVDLRYIWQMRARLWILQLHAEATVIVKIYCRLSMCTVLVLLFKYKQRQNYN